MSMEQVFMDKGTDYVYPLHISFDQAQHGHAASLDTIRSSEARYLRLLVLWGITLPISTVL